MDKAKDICGARCRGAVGSYRLSILLGPATVVSVAYIDPGNFGSNIAAGSRHGLNLLWVVWVSGLLAILFQYLSGKIGIALSRSLTDIVFESLSRRLYGSYYFIVRLIYFLALLAIVIATDMAEFLGIVLGLSLLLDLSVGVAMWVSVLDVLVLMIIADRRIGFETIIGSLVGIVGFSLIYELAIVKVDAFEIIRSSFIPGPMDASALLLAISILGATVMPHAVLIHSYLASEKWSSTPKYDSLKRHMRETIAYLSIASIINAAIQMMSYYAFYRNGYHDVDIDTVYLILQPLYGWSAATIFAIALIASGISSSMVSVLAGQKIVESMWGKKLEAWKLRLFVRLFNMIPLAIAIHIGVKPLDVLVYSQAVLSLLLPTVILPVTIISARSSIMGSLRNSLYMNIAAVIGSIFIVGLNLGFLLFGIA
ncbi:MAG: Nramp family divalent metal transporter [Sulfolobales archaeon]